MEEAAPVTLHEALAHPMALALEPSAARIALTAAWMNGPAVSAELVSAGGGAAKAVTTYTCGSITRVTRALRPACRRPKP